MAHVKLNAPKNCGGFHHGSKFYETDSDGQVSIPEELIEHALPHGFTTTGITDTVDSMEESNVDDGGNDSASEEETFTRKKKRNR